MFISHETMKNLVFDSRMNRNLWKPFIDGEIKKTDFKYISDLYQEIEEKQKR